jgi:DNA-binding transcriptional LysR family regulator
VQLRHLETFVAIVDEGTLTAAAGRLYKTQGAVSHDLRTFEAELGVTLIDRSGQRTELTGAGQMLLPHAREILHRVRDLQHAMDRMKAGEEVVRVGVLSSLSRIFAEFVAGYLRQAPESNIIVVAEPLDTLEAMLKDEQLDLALTKPITYGGLSSTTIAVEPFAIVLPRHHELADREELSAEDLADAPLIGFPRARSSGRAWAQFFAPMGKHPLPAVELGDPEAMCRLIELGVGYGLMPLSSVHGHEGLTTVPTRPRLSRRLAVVRSVDRFLPASAERFAAFLMEAWTRPDINASFAGTAVDRSPAPTAAASPG